MKVQSVLIPKKDSIPGIEGYTLGEAKDWLKNNGFVFKKVDITDNYYRFRQLEPSFGRYVTHSIPNGIKLVLGEK